MVHNAVPMRPLPRPFLHGPPLAALVLAAACGEQGPGDQPYVEDSTTLASLNDPANPRPAENEYVEVKGVVITGIDAYDETGTGQVGNLYVQDVNVVPQAFSGITVYNPGFILPDLRVVIGDVVDVRSPYLEFKGPASGPFEGGATLPELSGATVKFRFESPGTTVPKEITPDDLYEYESGRRWLGMLVTLKGVQLISDLSGSGRKSAQLRMTDMAGKDPGRIPRIQNSLYAIDKAGYELKAGETYDLTGVVQYFYSFSVNPRSADDIQSAQ